MIATQDSYAQTDDRLIYTRKDVLQKTIEYFNGDELAAEVWINKYCLKDSDGNLLEDNPDQMHRRLSFEFARIENLYVNALTEEDIYSLLKEFKYLIPQGSPMSGIGNDYQIVSLSNCFVIGNNELGDSYGGILKLDQELIQLQKRRAGVGIDLSFIRPRGTKVKNSAVTSTGIVPFMERYSNSTREVAQDGRRGALMESFSIVHPDAEDFIDAKLKQGKVTGANISVKITDQFMKAVQNNEPFTQQWPVDSDPKYITTIDSRKLWDKIIHNAWKSAEPGVLFWDIIIRESIPDCYAIDGFKTTSVNPCGEIPLNPYDSCRLLAINLYSYVENPFTKDSYFNFGLFKEHVYKAQRLMDDLVTLEVEKIDKIIHKIKSDPESEDVKKVELDLWFKIKDKCLQGRRTGLGITAEGDMLAALGITYGTDNSNKFSENVHKILKLASYRSSVDMSIERGEFEVWDYLKEKDNPFLLRIKKEDPELYRDMAMHGRRNISLLTVAPTGTVSLMTQTTSGLEPVFKTHYIRRRKVNPNDKDVRVDFIDDVGDSWQEYTVFHHKFETWLELHGYDIDDVKELSSDQLDEIICKSPYHKSTANDIDWVKKVEMQGMIQKHVDHSISVTVNLPHDVSEEVVSNVYLTGWTSGCKGITVYRDGSRSGVLVTKKESLFTDHHAPMRPKKLKAEVIRFQNNHEKWIAFVGLLDNRPYEIFTGKLENIDFDLPPSVNNGEILKRKNGNNKNVYDFIYTDKDGEKTLDYLSRQFNKEYWNYAKLISGTLRHGMPLLYVHDMISSLNLHDETLNTWKNGMSRVIKKYIPNGTKHKQKCTECSTDLIFQEGCLMCPNCGHSKCG